MSKIKFALIGLFSVSTGVVSGQSDGGLSISGTKIVSAAELEKFVYTPGENRIEALSFFGDIRCMGLPVFDESGVTFEFDRVINTPGVEPEARYDISGAVIGFNPDSAEISIDFPDELVPDCTHAIPAVGIISNDGSADPGAFWISGFDSLFDVSFELPPGEGFRVRLKNKSKITPFRNVDLRFTAPSGSTFAESIGSVSEGQNPGEWIWSIPLLWPQGAEDDEAVLDVFTTSLSEGIDVAEIESLPRDSFPASEPLLVTVINTSTSR